MSTYNPRFETVIRSFANDYFTVHIDKKNFTGDTTHIYRGNIPTIKYGGGRDEVNNVSVVSSLGRFSLWAEERYIDKGTNGREEFLELFESGFGDYRLSIYLNRTHLDSLSNAFNVNAGVSFILTGSTPYVSLNAAQDSKDLALEFTGAREDVAYSFNANFDIHAIGSGGIGEPPLIQGWSQATQPAAPATAITWQLNAPYNNRWIATVPIPYWPRWNFPLPTTLLPATTTELSIPITNGFAGLDYYVEVKVQFANVLVPTGFPNDFTFTLYDASDAIIDQIVQPLGGNTTLTLGLNFEGGATAPTRLGVVGHLNVSNYNSGDFWVEMSSGPYPSGGFPPNTAYLAPNTALPTISTTGASSLTTAGELYAKFLDASYNVIDSQLIGTWTGNTTITANFTLQSHALAKYLAFEAVQQSGDVSIVRLTSVASVGADNDFVYWRGMIDPSLINTTFIDNCYLLTIDAVCGLKDLDQTPLPESATTSSFIRMLSTIKECLNGTGIKLPIRSQINWHSIDVQSGSTLNQLFSNGKRFFDSKNGRITYWSLKDTLDRVLATFNATIKQESGYWQITNRLEENSPNYYYEYDTLIEKGNEPRNRLLNIDNRKNVLGSDQLSMIEPMVYSNVDIISAPTNDSYLFNGDFTQGADGWGNSTGSSAYDHFFFGSGYLQVQNGPPSANKNSMFGTTVYPNIDITTADTVTLSFNAKTQVRGPSPDFAEINSGYPMYRIEIIGISGSTEYNLHNASGSFQPPFDSWKTYTESFKLNLRLNTTYPPRYATRFQGQLKINVWTLYNNGNYGITSFFFDDFNISTQFVNTDIFSRYVTATNVDSTAIVRGDNDQYFSDTWSPIELATLKYSVTGNTHGGWNNYTNDMPSGRSITHLWLYEQMQQNSEFRNFVTLNVRSLDTKIEYDSILQINGTKYFVTEITKNLRDNTNELMLYEKIEPQDAEIVFAEGTYNTQGQPSSTSSGSGTGGGGGTGGAEPVIYYPGYGININSNIISVDSSILTGLTGGSGGGPSSGITNTSAIGHLPKTLDSSGNLTDSMINVNPSYFGSYKLAVDTQSAATLMFVPESSTASNINTWVASKGTGFAYLISQSLVSIGNSGGKDLQWDMTATNPVLMLTGAAPRLTAQEGQDLRVRGGIGNNSGANSGGHLHLSGGTAWQSSGSGNGGSVRIQPGKGGPSGADGDIIIRQLGGYIYIYGLPTSNPGGSNRLWNNSGVLNIT